jgi:hypothetical protein
MIEDGRLRKADLTSGLDAIQDRHAHIHQNQVVRDGRERTDRFGAIGYGVSMQA